MNVSSTRVTRSGDSACICTYMFEVFDAAGIFWWMHVCFLLTRVLIWDLKMTTIPVIKHGNGGRQPSICIDDVPNKIRYFGVISCHV